MEKKIQLKEIIQSKLNVHCACCIYVVANHNLNISVSILFKNIVEDCFEHKVCTQK